MSWRRARPLLIWSVLGAVVLVVAYLVMVRSGAGQWLDDVALDGRKSTRLAPRRAAARAVHVLTPVGVVALTLCSVVVAALRRGPVAAVAVVLAPATTLLASRGLKGGLPRDDLLIHSWVGPENSYPSGHTALATTVVLVAVAVCPPLWRARVAAVGAVGLVLHTLGIAASGWHRPSDLVGAVGLAVAVSSLASLAIVATWRGPREVPLRPWYGAPESVMVALATAVSLSFVWYLVIRLLGTSSYGSFKAHLAITLGTVALVVAVVAVQSGLVEEADLGRGAAPAGPEGSDGREQRVDHHTEQ